MNPVELRKFVPQGCHFFNGNISQKKKEVIFKNTNIITITKKNY